MGGALCEIPTRKGAQAHFDEAATAAREGRRVDALAALDRVFALSADFAEAWNLRGETLAALGRHAEALACFDRALTGRPDYVEALSNRGDALSSLGRPREALGYYNRCLAVKPNFARVVSRSAVALAALGRTEEALATFSRAIRLSPGDPEIHEALGDILSQLGEHAKALAHFARAQSLRPGVASGWSNGARALCAAGRWEEARDAFERALALEPTFTEALHGLASVFRQLGSLASALEYYDRALDVDPGHAHAAIGKGNVLSQLQRPAEALACFDSVLQRHPQLDAAERGRVAALDGMRRLSLAEVHYFRAQALFAAEQNAEAIEAFDSALALHPGYAEAWVGRGLALIEIEELTDALVSFERGAAAQPEKPIAYCNQSLALHKLARDEEALAAADRALALDPVSIPGLNNRGNSLRALGRLDEALGAYEKALALDPQDAQTLFNRAVCRLAAGDFAGGWADYEIRTKLRGFEKGAPKMLMPKWRGEEDVAGLTILLHAEQGHGDTIQFCRYAPFVADMGAEVALGVQPLLAPLLETLRGVRKIVRPDELDFKADYRCSFMSLPLVLAGRAAAIPASVPYLTAPHSRMARWRHRLGERRGPRIGIAWAGNPKHKNDRNRSIALSEWTRIAELGIPLYALQHDLPLSDVPAFAASTRVEYFGDELSDFADTAALIAQMDLVISVDTAVAHLAGALGKPVWTLLPHAPDWRWMQGREDSPWYPTMRLLRQPRAGDWPAVLERVRGDLSIWLARSRRSDTRASLGSPD